MGPSIRVEDRPEGKRLSIAATRGEVIGLLSSDASFRTAFSEELVRTGYDGFFWEMPPVRAASAHLPFECMIVPSAAVAKLVADDQPFGNFIAARVGTADVVRRANLGGDAVLIIPADAGDANYAHLAAFLRTAPPAQIHSLWREMADAANQWLGETPERTLWLGTSGLGVSWLHIRLDSRPKYYSFAPYKNPNA